MKTYEIDVNGKVYHVKVKEISPDQIPQTPTPAAAPPVATAAPVKTVGEVRIEAPMAGTILEVKVKVGDTVQKGQTIAILEAMKMENEIVAPADGTITAVHVTASQAVESNQLIVSM